MATYKVLQDIEAEDKLLGPLTLKQFIFAVIAIGIGFVEVKLITATALSVVRWPIVLVLLIPLLVFGFLAAPISRDQPNDIWLLARLRFLIKPHSRIWNQDGISNLVTITVPKKLEQILTDGLNQTEVRSRLNALANTLDSRGWAVKNVNTNLYAQPDYINNVDSDRLVAPQSLPQDVPMSDITTADDILDTANNAVAHHLDEMVQASAQTRRQNVVDRLQSPGQQQEAPADYWFMNQPSADTQASAQAATSVEPDYTVFRDQQVVAPGSTDSSIPAAPVTADETALLEKIKQDRENAAPIYGGLPTLKPLHDKYGNPVPAPPTTTDDYSTADADGVATQQTVHEPPKTQTTTPNPAILGLAQNDDLNVATIARQAQQLQGDDEVVISLH